MRTSELRSLIVTLLSSARDPDEPRQVVGLTCRQISERIEAFTPPNQDGRAGQPLAKRVSEQIEVLQSEFEVTSKGNGRKIYRMAPPSLIVERESPLRAKYVGDRAYINEVIELLHAICDMETRLVESSKSADESRDILESRGISVQTEKMLFGFLPEPQLPTQLDLSMAEHICEDDISASMEVYVPRRMNFFDKRWFKLDEARPSEMSQLRRIKKKSFRFGQSSDIYIWAFADKLYRLQRQQALLAMYRIDLDADAARLLDIESAIPIELRNQLPLDYLLFLKRYTDEIAFGPQAGSGGIDRNSSYLRAQFKYKGLLAELLETKLGINKPMS